MMPQPVEWVLVIHYGASAHRATYGRLSGTKYTKDYIQLSRKEEFLKTVSQLLAVTDEDGLSVPITYQWPKGKSNGSFVFVSADRPHLKWETRDGAPKAWRMAPTPTDDTDETIPGDPSHLDFAAAENELAMIEERGGGQPYLMATKLRNESRTLHVRAYLASPSEAYEWASLALAPKAIQALAAKTSQTSALAWSVFQSGGIAPNAELEDVLSRFETESIETVLDTLDVDTGRSLASYLGQPGYGLFFDPSQNHNAWLNPEPLSAGVAASIGEILETLELRFPPITQGDAAAETLEADPVEVEVFQSKIEQKSYDVPDSIATVKTRGSAQRAFADAVKTNYGYRCAITGSVTKDFLVASHIVPWSKDQSIRLDPSNGICLSLVADRAFEKGYLQIEDDLTIRIDWERVGPDQALRYQLEPYDGKKLSEPVKEPPSPEYLGRRRALVTPAE